MRAVKQLVAALLEIVASRGTVGDESSIREPSWDELLPLIRDAVVAEQQVEAVLEFYEQ